MGWGYGIDANGREIGYNVEAECDEPTCSTRIDRGLDYRCGPLNNERAPDLPGCGGYFCYEHLSWHATVPAAPGGGFCDACILTIDLGRIDA